LPVLEVSPEFKDQLVSKVNKEVQEPLDPLELQVQLDHKVLMVRQVLLDQQEKAVTREQLDHQEPPDRPDF